MARKPSKAPTSAKPKGGKAASGGASKSAKRASAKKPTAAKSGTAAAKGRRVSSGRKTSTKSTEDGVAAAASRAASVARGGEARLPRVAQADLSGLQDSKLYYRIGEVSQITGVKPYVLRYWESEFRLMTPQKSRSKQRLYRRKDIEAILHIKRLLYEERYTIAGARKQLRDLGAARVCSGPAGGIKERDRVLRRRRLYAGRDDPG